MAAKAVTDGCTKENLAIAQKHATKENAETAYEGAKWANNKADELGIDKTEVATKAGSALWGGMKLLASSSSSTK